MDNITRHLSGLRAQTWQPMNSLLMDGQEERQEERRISTVGPFWSSVFFSAVLGMCSYSVYQLESELCEAQ